MSDLVERLRAAASDPMWAYHCEIRKLTASEAADMIERLRAELADVRDQAARLIRDLDAVSREREQLQAERDARRIAKALAIAQAVDEFQNDMNMTDDQKRQSFIIKRADELLKEKP